MTHFENFLLVEDYKSKLQEFVSQGNPQDVVLVYLNTHQIVKDLYKTKLSPEQKNIDAFKSFNDLQALIDKLKNEANPLDFDKKVNAASMNLAQKRFKGQMLDGKPASPADITQIVKQFMDSISSMPAVPFPKNNINSYKNIQDVKNIVANTPQQTSKTEEDEYDIQPTSAKVLYDDDKIIIYQSLSPQACIEAKGKHPTSWCVASSNIAGNAYYKYRTGLGKPTFYFVKNKKKTEAEGDPVHQRYKDPYHFFVVMVLEDGTYRVSSANNDDHTETWDKIIATEPLLADKKNLFVWVPHTEKEQFADKIKQGVNLETFKNYNTEQKTMYIQVGPLLPNDIWDTLSDELKYLAVNNYKAQSQHQLNDIRKNKKLYKRQLQIYNDTNNITLLTKEINNNYDNPVAAAWLENQKTLDDFIRTILDENFSQVHPEIWRNKLNQKAKVELAIKGKVSKEQYEEIVNSDFYEEYFKNLMRLAYTETIQTEIGKNFNHPVVQKYLKDPSFIEKLIKHQTSAINPIIWKILSPEQKLDHVIASNSVRPEFYQELVQQPEQYDKYLQAISKDRQTININQNKVLNELLFNNTYPEKTEQFKTKVFNLAPFYILGYIFQAKDADAEEVIKKYQDVIQNFSHEYLFYATDFIMDTRSKMAGLIQLKKFNQFLDFDDKSLFKSRLPYDPEQIRKLIGDFVAYDRGMGSSKTRERVEAAIRELCDEWKDTIAFLLRVFTKLPQQFKENLKNISKSCYSKIQYPESLKSFKVWLEWIENN